VDQDQRRRHDHDRRRRQDREAHPGEVTRARVRRPSPPDPPQPVPAMPRLLLAPAVLLASSLAAGAQEKPDAKDKQVEVDPKSNIKDKIFGKWKLVSVPGPDADQFKQLEALKVYVFMEFTPDGTATIGCASDDPEVQKLLDNSPQKWTLACKYRLPAG